MALGELDIWRSAHLLIKQHGEDAGFVAAQKADALLAKGDADGFHAWVRIGRAIGDLTKIIPDGNQRIN